MILLQGTYSRADTGSKVSGTRHRRQTDDILMFVAVHGVTVGDPRWTARVALVILGRGKAFARDKTVRFAGLIRKKETVT